MIKFKRLQSLSAVVALLAVGGAAVLTPTHAQAHGAMHHGKSHQLSSSLSTPEQKEWGIAGDVKSITRTITIQMSDDMRFRPDKIAVKLNETIQFRVLNQGKVLHEMVIGTKAELNQHAEMMKKHPNMEHDEPYMAHVSPGQSGDMIWMFNRPGRFHFACLIPGHYEAGMQGTIEVTP